MGMNRFQRYGERAVSVICGLALAAAGAAACVLRGFFFTGEMYSFLTVWFAMCGVLTLGALVLYAASGRGDGQKLEGKLPGSAATALALTAGVVKDTAAEGAAEVLKGSVQLMSGDGGKGEITEDGAGELKGNCQLMTGDRGKDAIAEGAAAEAAVETMSGSGWMLDRRAGGGLRVKAAALLLPGCSAVICILYGIHLLRGPLSAQGTLNEWLRWGLYASFAVFALLAAGARRGRFILAAVWHLLGLVISLSALFAVCGGLPLPYAVAYSQSPEVSATGARLAGLLQYPNTFGAVMAVFLLERLFAVAYDSGLKTGSGAGYGGFIGIRHQWSKRVPTVSGADPGGMLGVAGRASTVSGAEPAGTGPAELWLRAARLLPLFPYAAALLLSESRGAWLAAAAAGAAALLWKRQLSAPLLLAGAAPVAAAALLYRQLAKAGLAAEPVPGLLLLAGLWAGALLAGLWLHRRSCRAAGGYRAAMLALAAGAWTAAGSAVLLQVRARMTGPSPTADARGLMYRDAWKLAAEAPWLGRGGETWRHSYLAAQSRPYVGSQVHSGYLDILLNLGTAGLAAVLLLLLAAGWLVFKASPRMLPPLLVIILHSAVDFDWSYGLIWLLLFLMPAWALAEAKYRPAAQDTAILTAALATPAPVPGTAAATTAAPADQITAEEAHAVEISGAVSAASGTYAESAWWIIVTRYPQSARTLPGRPLLLSQQSRSCTGIAVACALTFMLSTLSFQAMSGAAFYKQAARVSGDAAAQTSLLRQSLERNPREPQTAAALSRLLMQEQGTELLLRSLKYSPGNAALHWALAERYLQDSRPGEALYWIRRSLQLDVYNAAKRRAAIEGMLEMGERGLAEGDRQMAAACAAAGLELLRQFSLLAGEEQGKGRQHNDRGFAINPQEAEGAYLRLSNLQALAMHDQQKKIATR